MYISLTALAVTTTLLVVAAYRLGSLKIELQEAKVRLESQEELRRSEAEDLWRNIEDLRDGYENEFLELREQLKKAREECEAYKTERDFLARVIDKHSERCDGMLDDHVELIRNQLELVEIEAQ